jgi:gliding motility-associated-like protein
MSRLRYLLLLILIATVYKVHAQQDMDLHLSDTFLAGKNILKVKRDFTDPYLWVLAQNNEVYRINSITKVIDDFTAKFNTYSSYKFIDIAGDSKDAVFIATNSSNVIRYNNDVLSLIGTIDGLLGTVNSIGFDYTKTGIYANMNGDISNDQLLIATSVGIFRYVLKDGKIAQPNLPSGNSQIFESTVRTAMYTYIVTRQPWPDEFVYYPTLCQTYSTSYAGYINLEGNVFGHTVKSAYYNNGEYYHNTGFSIFGSQFWATENGLFKNTWNYSYRENFGYKHYLEGVNINKITSIYGLNNFNLYTRENLLIGSTQGLYFSNSTYAYSLSETMFTHYDGLGTKTINDICVNAISYTVPVTNCEDGAWVAADDGLYLLKPDYGPYINSSTQLQAVQFDGQDPSVNKIEICANSSINALANNYTNGAVPLQWFKNGKEIPNESHATLTIKDPGEYYMIIYDPCSALHFESNHLTVTQVTAPVFSFNYPDVLNYCAGSSATLKTYDKPNYQYRWYKDGILNGNTTATLDNITETGKYKVEVSACAGNWVASKEVQVNFIAIPTPVLTTDKVSYCDGDQATLSANVPIDASAILNWTSYQYAWYKDGSPITGNTASINVSQPGKYKVVVSGCSGSVSSAELQIDFIKLPKSVITASKPAYCIGDKAQLTANFNIDPFTTVSWLRDGNILPDEQDKASITTNIGGNYTVTVVSAGSCNITSSAYNLGFTPPPTVSVQQIVNTTLCDGQTVDLKASYTSGTVTWSTGATSDKISIQHSGTFKATVTTTAGCTVDESATVQYFPNPTLNVPSATLCQYTNESITLTAPAGFVKYEWNGQPGTNTFTTNKLGSVILTVTDNNGCQASQTIAISSHCDDIHIPNAFSPNGDGHNDTWVIAGLEGDPTTTVRVYNRLGSMVFQSQGYATPWNGTYNGSKLPASVYYYVISTKGTKQVLSGSVTIFN